MNDGEKLKQWYDSMSTEDKERVFDWLASALSNREMSQWKQFPVREALQQIAYVYELNEHSLGEYS